MGPASASTGTTLQAGPMSRDAHFKLHAPYETTVSGRVEAGRVVALFVEPESRRADLIISKP